uniref:Uncharacterized protein n=1 Tax=Anguilla anguilla TaxID=7936 RepID=A0A0E9U7J1_ANGAN
MGPIYHCKRALTDTKIPNLGPIHTLEQSLSRFQTIQPILVDQLTTGSLV